MKVGGNVPKCMIEFMVNYPVEIVCVSCKEAIAQLGWKIIKQSSSFIKCIEPISGVSFNWATRIEVSWQENGSSLKIRLNGSIAGFGPIQSNHLKGQIGNLHNRIELCLRNEAALRRNASAPQFSIAEELDKLIKLRVRGILTEDEFQSAKEKLIN